MTGSSAVYPRLISGTRSALSSWLLTSVPSLICLCKPFSCRACSRKMRLLYVFFPGHALYDKDLQRQISVGTLVSSQERRALAVQLMNRLSFAGQSLVNCGSAADFVPLSVYMGLRLFVLPKRRPGQYFRFAGGQEGGLSPCRIVPTAFRPSSIQPRPPSPPRRARPRHDWPQCSRFLDSTGMRAEQKIRSNILRG